MKISRDLIQQSKARLGFDPRQERERLRRERQVGVKPIAQESSDRRDNRISHILREAGEASRIEWERVIQDSDLMNINYLERGIVAANSVGRIIVRGSAGELLGYATGFMVAPRLLMTNNHVLGSKDACENSHVEFNYQFDATGKPRTSRLFVLQPDEFYFTSPELDFSVVAVSDTSQDGASGLDQFGWLRLNAKVGKVASGECLSITQHPGGEYKQIAIRQNQLIKIEPQHLWYVTDTGQGSSGSPVFNDLWQVVALHHSGVPQTDDQGNYLTVDGKIWNDQMDESKIKWIANEGVRISCIVDCIKKAWPDQPLIEAMLEEQLTALPNLPDGSLPTITPGTARGNGHAEPVSGKSKGSTVVPDATREEGGVRLTVPLHLTITLGQPSAVTLGPAAGAGRLPTGEVISIDPNYDNRKGYAPTFLGTGEKRVPLPELSAAMKAQAAQRIGATGAERYVLPYHHFAVVMNGERKMAFFTAVNIDGKLAQAIERETDKWFFDPRIDRACQAGNDIYASNPLDRGHLVRRLDPAWGSPLGVAQVANDDTFHFTNCTPQHKDFNQNKTTWAGLEDYVLDNAKAKDLKVSVFTGPVFGKNDPPYRGIWLPKQFWKVVVMAKPDSGTLSATAYLLSQSNLLQDLEADVFSYGAYKTYQVPIKKIEALTGLKFGNLRSFDPMNLEEAIGFREIAAYGDVRL